MTVYERDVLLSRVRVAVSLFLQPTAPRCRYTRLGLLLSFSFFSGVTTCLEGKVEQSLYIRSVSMGLSVAGCTFSPSVFFSVPVEFDACPSERDRRFYSRVVFERR